MLICLKTLIYGALAIRVQLGRNTYLEVEEHKMNFSRIYAKHRKLPEKKAEMQKVAKNLIRLLSRVPVLRRWSSGLA